MSKLDYEEIGEGIEDGIKKTDGFLKKYRWYISSVSAAVGIAFMFFMMK